VPDPSYTIDEFCTAERISRGMYYKLKEFYVGNRPRISHRARTEWRERLEAETAAPKTAGGK
jgi:hypothetical protein